MNVFTPESNAGIQMQSTTNPAYLFREEYSGLIAKGNFMTLATKPAHIEEGEWLAHQGRITNY
jgi:hypothetical protein